MPRELRNWYDTLGDRIQLVNLYGPTEAAVYTTNYSLSKWDGTGNVPIGKPLSNVTVYILDKYEHIQPMGIPGELSIGGEGLARGYLNRPELTAEKFLPISNRSYRSYISKEIYKTGDLARWLPEGNIEFLGRMDHQVKIRGFRIELGEIENQLLTHEKVNEAVLIAREDSSKDKYLCAYLVVKREEPTTIEPLEFRTICSPLILYSLIKSR